MSEKLDRAERAGRDPMPAAEADAEVDVAGAFETHHAMVYRAAWRVTGNAGDAEDAMQTVFLRLLRRPGEARAVEHIAAYLHRAAVNAALDLVRAREAERGVALDTASPPADSAPGAERVLASADLRRWLRGAVARLSPQAAEIFALRFYEGYGNAEIARMVGTTEGTVAVTISRARERIQREYESYTGGKHAAR